MEAPGGDPLRRWSASGAAIRRGRRRRAVQLPRLRPSAAWWSMMRRPAACVPCTRCWIRSTPWSGRRARRWPSRCRCTRRSCSAPIRTWSSRRSHPSASRDPGAACRRPNSRCRPGPGGSSDWRVGRPDRPPVFVGGQVGEWLAGLYGAIGTLAANRRDGAAGDVVDVSMLEVLAMTLTYYPVTFNDQLGRPMRRKRFVATPGVGAAQRRARRARVRDGAAVAGLLRAGGAPRVDGGPVAVPRPHRVDPRHRRLDRGSHRR